MGVCLSQKVLGAVVFAACVVAMLVLLPGGAPAFTWVLLGVFGISSGLATIANFGERVTVDASGIAQRNVLLARIGLAGRRAAWPDVLGAVDQDRRTIFLDVRDQRRWVIDHIDG